MNTNPPPKFPKSQARWSRPRTAALASLLAASALVWTALALNVHTSASAALDPDSVTNADVARLGASAMAGLAAMAAGMWWRHWTTARRPAIGGGWARGACALSVLHSLLTVPVILFASWSWRATVIAFTCAVIAAGVREAAAVSAPMGRVAAPAGA